GPTAPEAEPAQPEPFAAQERRRGDIAVATAARWPFVTFDRSAQRTCCADETRSSVAHRERCCRWTTTIRVSLIDSSWRNAHRARDVYGQRRRQMTTLVPALSLQLIPLGSEKSAALAGTQRVATCRSATT